VPAPADAPRFSSRARYPYTIDDVAPGDAPRDDVAAMLAARQELGPDYEQALIDGFVSRIGQAIDERVDTRLAGVRAPEVTVQRGAKSGRGDSSQLILALGSLGLAVPLSGIAASYEHLPGLIVCWAGVTIVNVAHALYRRERH